MGTSPLIKTSDNLTENEPEDIFRLLCRVSWSKLGKNGKILPFLPWLKIQKDNDLGEMVSNAIALYHSQLRNQLRKEDITDNNFSSFMKISLRHNWISTMKY